MTDVTDSMDANWDWARAHLTARRRQLIAQVERVEGDLRWFDTNVEPELLEEGQEQALSTVLARLDEHDRADILEPCSACAVRRRAAATWSPATATTCSPRQRRSSGPTPVGASLGLPGPASTRRV